MEIQRLVPGDDTTVVARLCREVQAMHAAVDPVHYRKPGRRFVAEAARWFASLLSDLDRFVLLGTVSGEPVAYASAALIEHPKDMYHNAYFTLYVDQFGVSEKQRGKGYGRLFVQGLIEIGRINEVHDITLDVQAFNSGAVEFYRRCGFDMQRHRMMLADPF